MFWGDKVSQKYTDQFLKILINNHTNNAFGWLIESNNKQDHSNQWYHVHSKVTHHSQINTWCFQLDPHTWSSQASPIFHSLSTKNTLFVSLHYISTCTLSTTQDNSIISKGQFARKLTFMGSNLTVSGIIHFVVKCTIKTQTGLKQHDGEQRERYVKTVPPLWWHEVQWSRSSQSSWFAGDQWCLSSVQ